MLRAGVWLRHGAGSRFRSCGAARCTAGEVPQIGPSLLSNLKRCFPPLTCARIPGLGAPGMDFARGRLAPVISPAPRCDRCSAFTQQLPELACASADLRASTSWLPQAVEPSASQAGARVVNATCDGPSCASQPPCWAQWLVRTAGGSPKILGEGSGLGAPAPLAAQAAASGAHRRQRRTAPLSSPR